MADEFDCEDQDGEKNGTEEQPWPILHQVGYLRHFEGCGLQTQLAVVCVII
jgi:hypothetical protein